MNSFLYANFSYRGREIRIYLDPDRVYSCVTNGEKVHVQSGFGSVQYARRAGENSIDIEMASSTRKHHWIRRVKKNLMH